MTVANYSKTISYIGHYGCAGRLVKVRHRTNTLRGDGGSMRRNPFLKPKALHTVVCPACGFRHDIDVLWRPAQWGELGRAEISVG
jgi:hypothetical protein